MTKKTRILHTRSTFSAEILYNINKPVRIFDQDRSFLILKLSTSDREYCMQNCHHLKLKNFIWYYIIIPIQKKAAIIDVSYLSSLGKFGNILTIYVFYTHVWAYIVSPLVDRSSSFSSWPLFVDGHAPWRYNDKNVFVIPQTPPQS